MYEDGDSYIKVNAVDVQKKCRAVIKRIQDARKENDRIYVENEMLWNAKWAKWFWFLGVKEKTYEEMHLSLLKDRSLHRIWSYPDTNTSDSFLQLAETLVSMCDASTERTVYMSTSDYRSIFM